MSGHSDKPPGWKEPLYEPLLYPDSFFGARPRWFVFSIYTLGIFLMMALVSAQEMLSAAAVLGTVLTVHILLAIIGSPRVEPFWNQVLGDWFESPSERIDP